RQLHSDRLLLVEHPHGCEECSEFLLICPKFLLHTIAFAFVGRLKITTLRRPCWSEEAQDRKKQHDWILHGRKLKYRRRFAFGTIHTKNWQGSHYLRGHRANEEHDETDDCIDHSRSWRGHSTGTRSKQR